MTLPSPRPNQISASGSSAIDGSGLNIDVSSLEQVGADARGAGERGEQHRQDQPGDVALQQQRQRVDRWRAAARRRRSTSHSAATVAENVGNSSALFEPARVAFPDRCQRRRAGGPCAAASDMRVRAADRGPRRDRDSTPACASSAPSPNSMSLDACRQPLAASSTGRAGAPTSALTRPGMRAEQQDAVADADRPRGSSASRTAP